MYISSANNGITVSGLSDFDLGQIFECGQTFRFDHEPDGSYVGVADGKIVKITQRNGVLQLIGANEHDFKNFWYDYFDLGRDYAAVKSIIIVDDVIKSAVNYGGGIRILRQDAFEMLISFIISQNNNIPRIKKIISAICRQYGKPIPSPFDNRTFYSFPSAEKLNGLTENDLAFCRCGFRAKYIADAVQKVNNGLDLASLRTLPYHSAANLLLTVKGVGPKVADCVLLFGASHFEAFPIDVWMKKAIKILYNKEPDEFDPAVYGAYGGIAQQYLFYYMRDHIHDYSHNEN